MVCSFHCPVRTHFGLQRKSPEMPLSGRCVWWLSLPSTSTQIDTTGYGKFHVWSGAFPLLPPPPVALGEPILGQLQAPCGVGSLGPPMLPSTHILLEGEAGPPVILIP